MKNTISFTNSKENAATTLKSSERSFYLEERNGNVALFYVAKNKYGILTNGLVMEIGPNNMIELFTVTKAVHVIE